MPSSNFSAWYIQKGGVNYLAGPDNNTIIYRPNNWNEANLVFNIADKSDVARGAFTAEDAVSVWIGDPAGSGVKMIDGFILYKYPIRRRDASQSLYVTVVDYIGYLAAKSIFEERYWLLANSTSKQIFADAAAAIPGIGGTNIDSNLTNLVQQDFSGTYAKDGFTVASQVGYADYFGDESHVLQAFSHGGRDLLAPNSVRYKIVDGTPVGANQIRVNTNFDYYFKYDATNRFKTVVTTSGIQYTYPQDIDQFQQPSETNNLRGLYGRDFSTHYTPLGPRSSYDKNIVPTPPIPFNFTQMSIGAINYPVLILNVANSSDNISMLIGQMDIQTGTFPTFSALNAPIPLDGTWQEVSFFMRIDTLTPTPTNVQIFLIDLTNFGTYSRYLKQGSTTLFISGGMTFIRFLLPTPLAANGWTLAGTAKIIDQIQIVFSPTSGYTAGTNVLMSQFYFFKKVRQQSSTVGGSPTTAKIIMNRTITDQTSLLAMANAEFSRVSPMPYEAKFTFYGNSDFRKPGYAIDADLTGLLEPDSKGTQLRIDNIVHYLDKSRWNTELTLKPAYQNTN